MNRETFDEYQKMIRYRIAFETLIIVFVLMFIKAFMDEYHVFDLPLIETMVLYFIATAYYVTRTILKNAYFSLQAESTGKIVSRFGYVAIFWDVISIILYIRYLSSPMNDIEKAKNLLPIFLPAALFSYIAILAFIRKRINIARDKNES